MRRLDFPFLFSLLFSPSLRPGQGRGGFTEAYRPARFDETYDMMMSDEASRSDTWTADTGLSGLPFGDGYVDVGWACIVQVLFGQLAVFSLPLFLLACSALRAGFVWTND